MPNPLTSELIGGPLDGGVCDINPAFGLLVGVESGTPGVTHVYVLRPLTPARLVYVETRRERPKATRLLKGGLDR